jgi:hypothetical protein
LGGEVGNFFEERAMGLRYAVDRNGDRITPSFTGEIASCPTCGSPVHARCGTIVVWHWGHTSGSDCDPWAEHITPWHLGWQKKLEEHGALIEHVIDDGFDTHRADAYFRKGKQVVELQHSPLSTSEIEEREDFYGNMVWVFDATEAFAQERLLIRPKPGKKYHTFRWKHPRKTIAYAKKTVLLDLGNGSVFQVEKMHPEAPCGGWGYLLTIAEILK